MTQHQPITREGFDGLLEWHDAEKDGRAASPELLTLGLPHSNIVTATTGRDASGPYVEASIRGASNPRLFDPAAFLCARLLVLPRGTIHVRHNTPERLHYVMFHDDTSAMRIIAGTSGEDEVARFVDNHPDLRRRNLYLTTSAAQHPYKGREYVIGLTLMHFAKDRSQGRLDHIPISSTDLEIMLREGFELLDRLPLGKAP